MTSGRSGKGLLVCLGGGGDHIMTFFHWPITRSGGNCKVPGPGNSLPSWPADSRETMLAAGMVGRPVRALWVGICSFLCCVYPLEPMPCL